MRKYMLFDLDGTLTRSDEGIMKSIRYALEKMGFMERNDEKLKSFIGPPLEDSFRNSYGMSKEKCQKAIEFYREYYADKGIFECEVYEGLPQMLDILKNKAGRHLAVVSSKPIEFTEKILEHFDLAKYFDFVVAPEFGNETTKKEDLVKEALEKWGADPHECLMVGDRKFDVLAAEANHIYSIGVLYGYGTMTELMNAGGGVDYVVSTPKGLAEKLIGMPVNTDVYFSNMLLQ